MVAFSSKDTSSKHFQEESYSLMWLWSVSRKPLTVPALRIVCCKQPKQRNWSPGSQSCSETDCRKAANQSESKDQTLGRGFDFTALAYSFNFPSSFSSMIWQSFTSQVSPQLFPLLLPFSSLILCKFRRTNNSFHSLSCLPAHCSQLAPVKHIQDASFTFFFPSLVSPVEMDLIGKLWSTEIWGKYFTNFRGICKMKLTGNKDETEVL